MIKNARKKVVRYFGKCVASSALVLGSSVAAMAEPTLTIPEIDTAVLYQCAGGAFAAVAIVIAILIGLRLFKSAGSR